ncbi:uncharacterized protein [Ptychodera flava]|uniref:uncharacterized protein n=1 Tax=Ptychodera flava TaxID=63121 RepID=UPI003969FE84
MSEGKKTPEDCQDKEKQEQGTKSGNSQKGGSGISGKSTRDERRITVRLEKNAVRSKKILSRLGVRKIGKPRKSKQKALLGTSKKKGHFNFKPFVCALCNAGFKYEQVLVYHVRGHTGEKPYECDQCDFASIQPAGLEVHRRIVHNLNSCKCSQCGEAFRNEATLKLHSRMHSSKAGSSAKPVSETESEQKGKEKSAKEERNSRSEDTDTKKESKEKVTDGDLLDDKANNKAMNDTEDENRDTMYLCESCSFTCSKEDVYKNHMIQEHNVDVDNQEDVSKQEGISNSLKETPPTQKKATEPVSSISKVDQAAAERESQFADYLKPRTDEHGNKFWTCLKCTFVRFTQKSAFMHHIVSCQRRLVYDCDSCDFLAVKVAELQEHKVKMHQPASLPAPQHSQLQFVCGCEVCGYATTSINALAEHRFQKHGLPKSTCTEFGFQEKAVYICELCKYITTSSHDYLSHKQTAHASMLGRFIGPKLTQQARQQTYFNPVVEVRRLQIPEKTVENKKQKKAPAKSTVVSEKTKTSTSMEKEVNKVQSASSAKSANEVQYVETVHYWKMKCENCQMQLNSAFEIAHHRKEVKDNWYNCRCHVCKYAATSLCDLECHKQQYHRHICKMCDATCTSEADLINHTRLVHPLIYKHRYGDFAAGPGRIEQTSHTSSLQSASINVKQTRRKVLTVSRVCRACKLVCSSETELVTHIREKHPVMYRRKYGIQSNNPTIINQRPYQPPVQLTVKAKKPTNQPDHGTVAPKLPKDTNNTPRSVEKTTDPINRVCEKTHEKLIDLRNPLKAVPKMKPVYSKQKSKEDKLLDRESETDISDDDTDEEEEEKLIEMLEENDESTSSDDDDDDDDDEEDEEDGENERDSFKETNKIFSQPQMNSKLSLSTPVTPAPLPRTPQLHPNTEPPKLRLAFIHGMHLYSSLGLYLFPEDGKSFQERQKEPFALMPVEDIQSLNKDFITRTHAATLSFFIDRAMLLHTRSVLKRRKRWTYYSLPDIRKDTSSTQVSTSNQADNRKRGRPSMKKQAQVKPSEATEVSDILELKSQAEKQLAMLTNTSQPSSSSSAKPQKANIPTDKNMLDRSIGVTLDMIRKIQQLVREGTLTQQLSREIAPHCQVICNPYASLQDKLRHVEIINFVITKRTGIGLNELASAQQTLPLSRPGNKTHGETLHQSGVIQQKNSSSIPTGQVRASDNQTGDSKQANMQAKASNSQTTQPSRRLTQQTPKTGTGVSVDSSASKGSDKTKKQQNVETGKVVRGHAANSDKHSSSQCKVTAVASKQRQKHLQTKSNEMKNGEGSSKKAEDNNAAKSEEDRRNLSLYVYQERKSKRAAEEKMKAGVKAQKATSQKSESSAKLRRLHERKLQARKRDRNLKKKEYRSRRRNVRNQANESSSSDEEDHGKDLVSRRRVRSQSSKVKKTSDVHKESTRSLHTARSHRSVRRASRVDEKTDSDDSDGWAEVRITRSGMKVIHKSEQSRRSWEANRKREPDSSSGDESESEEMQPRLRKTRQRALSGTKRDRDTENDGKKYEKKTEKDKKAVDTTSRMRKTSRHGKNGESSSSDEEIRSRVTPESRKLFLKSNVNEEDSSDGSSDNTPVSRSTRSGVHVVQKVKTDTGKEMKGKRKSEMTAEDNPESDDSDGNSKRRTTRHGTVHTENRARRKSPRICDHTPQTRLEKGMPQRERPSDSDVTKSKTD